MKMGSRKGVTVRQVAGNIRPYRGMQNSVNKAWKMHSWPHREREIFIAPSVAWEAFEFLNMTTISSSSRPSLKTIFFIE